MNKPGNEPPKPEGQGNGVLIDLEGWCQLLQQEQELSLQIVKHINLLRAAAILIGGMVIVLNLTLYEYQPPLRYSWIFLCNAGASLIGIIIALLIRPGNRILNRGG